MYNPPLRSRYGVLFTVKSWTGRRADHHDRLIRYYTEVHKCSHLVLVNYVRVLKQIIDNVRRTKHKKGAPNRTVKKFNARRSIRNKTMEKRMWEYSTISSRLGA